VSDDFFVHESAIVEDGASIGAGTRVWHHAHVRAGAVIGRGCSLGKNVYVDAGVCIGNRVKIQNNVSVYHGVTLEDDVFVGPSAVFTNDRYPRAHVADWPLVETRVRRGASIGANATIVCGVEIGPAAMVGAGAVISHPVDANQLVYGQPAEVRGWVCWCGAVLSRADERPHDAKCAQCGRTFGSLG
jgi:UDP-3-O-[3-hydroxymyristoyl] glucosamine N-acyltransferase